VTVGATVKILLATRRSTPYAPAALAAGTFYAIITSSVTTFTNF
jgi:hypothetical protein